MGLCNDTPYQDEDTLTFVRMALVLDDSQVKTFDKIRPRAPKKTDKDYTEFVQAVDRLMGSFITQTM